MCASYKQGYIQDLSSDTRKVQTGIHMRYRHIHADRTGKVQGLVLRLFGWGWGDRYYNIDCNAMKMDDRPV